MTRADAANKREINRRKISRDKRAGRGATARHLYTRRHGAYIRGQKKRKKKKRGAKRGEESRAIATAVTTESGPYIDTSTPLAKAQRLSNGGSGSGEDNR